MAYVLLRRVPVANVAPATGFTVRVDQYDTVARRPYRDAIQAPTNTGANAPFELTVGQLVPGASFCIGTTQRQVRYAGGGNVSTKDVVGAIACASTLANLTVTTAGLLGPATDPTATLTVKWQGGVGSFTVRVGLLTPGFADTPPYYEERNVPEGTRTATLPSLTFGGFARRDRERRLSPFVPVGGLAPGRYRVEVIEDVTGYLLAQDITLDAGKNNDPQGRRQVTLWSNGQELEASNDQFALYENGPLRVVVRFRPDRHKRVYVEPKASSSILLSLRTTPNSEGRSRIVGVFYDATTGRVETGEYLLDRARVPAGAPDYAVAIPELVYHLPAGHHMPGAPGGFFEPLPVYSNGQGGIVRQAPLPQRLALDNLMLFSPPKAGEATGGVIVEAHTWQDLEAAPQVEYRVYEAAGALLATNATGRFNGLAAGSYRATISAGGVTTSVPFALNAPYGLKAILEFRDQKNNAKCRLEMWVRGYVGPVQQLLGETGNPLTLTTEALQGGDTQADMPASAGSSLAIRLFTKRGEWQDVVIDDRACRTDFYYRDVLHFSGYVQPEIYEEALVGGKGKASVKVELTATCGLAALKDVDFLGHVGQELRGRRALLPTLLHCLSRTGLALPVHIATNRVAWEMTTDEVPELALFTDRLAYAEKNMREVADAVAQTLGGTLVQRRGQWAVLSALEAAALARARTYGPAGGAEVDPTPVPAPTAKLLPSDAAAEEADGVHTAWYWLKGTQTRSRRAGWRFFTGTGDAGFAKNAFQQGTYFGNPDVWDASATVLRPEAGWLAGPGGFPLSLLSAGEEADETGASWPSLTSDTDARYLESEVVPLAAGLEGAAYEISVEAKLLARTNQTARLWVEIISDQGIFGSANVSAVLAFKPVASLKDGFATAKVLIPVGLLARTSAARVRLHPYTIYPVGRARTGGDGYPEHYLLVKSVGLQVLPQGAKWDGKTSFVASGEGGSVRPGSPLEVFHVDAPDRAGLFLGTAGAFRRTVTRGPLSPTTQWARADDMAPASLLASAVLDVLALRAGPSQLLKGVVRHLGLPPELLDSFDAPSDVPGRRFCVGSRAWHIRPAETELTALEIGEGERFAVPQNFLPSPVRLLDGLLAGRRKVRLTDRGVRVLHP